MATSTTTARTVAAGYVPGTSAIAARLLARDGLFTVGRRYFASAGAAALVRRTVAARLRADAVRGVPSALRVLRALLRPVGGESQPGRTVCPWCRGAVQPTDAVVQTGGRILHDACGAALDVVLSAAAGNA